MIAVDTSALMAIVQNEDTAAACMAVLLTEERFVISAVTVSEALIVAGRRDLGESMRRLLDELGFEVRGVSAAVARRVAEIYAVWGKGLHPAALNFADCFSYETARENGCALLCVGEDFRRTDIATVP